MSGWGDRWGDRWGGRWGSAVVEIPGEAPYVDEFVAVSAQDRFVTVRAIGHRSVVVQPEGREVLS